MALVLILFPLAMALAAFFTPSPRLRPWLIPITGTVHAMMVFSAVASPEDASFGGWLHLDRLGRVFLAQTSVVYLLCSFYAPAYLAKHPERDNRVFTSALLAIIGIISLHIQAQHLGLMWIALESLTLTCAPMLYFRRNPRSLEAAWKYLLVGSVGIALALLGSFFLGYSALQAGLHSTLLFEDLIAQAPKLSRPWLDTAFILLFVGYGTKMGLAPMHTWKPDAYGEAPGLVGTLLAGCVTSCAFLAILRFYQISHATGDTSFVRQIMITLGLLSMVVAGVFMTRQRDYKRMLAYSSVEHMGILFLGIGIGGSAIFGALLHLLNNGITKGVMFLSAGNIHQEYGSKMTTEVSGALRRVPASGVLFLAGFFAVTGSPPFCMFLSEFTILREAIASGQLLVAGAFLLMLFIVFVGMGATVLSVVQGAPPPGTEHQRSREPFLMVAPAAAFLGLALLLGLYVPKPVETMLREAAAFLEAAS